MPLREYRCSACGEVIEVLQKINERKPGTCENCGAKGTLEKEMSASAFHLKGGGWYKDLYASTPKSDAEGSKKKKKSSDSASKKSKKKSGS